MEEGRESNNSGGGGGGVGVLVGVIGRHDDRNGGGGEGAVSNAQCRNNAMLARRRAVQSILCPLLRPNIVDLVEIQEELSPALPPSPVFGEALILSSFPVRGKRGERGLLFSLLLNPCQHAMLAGHHPRSPPLSPCMEHIDCRGGVAACLAVCRTRRRRPRDCESVSRRPCRERCVET